MNRSILIVTCDFLVLAAMSLSMGMNKVGDPASNKGGGTEVPTSNLVQLIDAELEQRANTLKEKELLEKQLEELNATLEKEKKLLAEQDKKLADKSAEAAGIADSLEKMRTESRALSENLAKRESELKKATQKIATQDIALKDASQLLNEKEKALETTTTQLNAKTTELKTATTKLGEKEKALQNATTQLNAKTTELKTATTQLGEKEKALQNATTQLSKKEEELQSSKIDLAQRDIMLKANEEALAASERALESYRKEAKDSDSLRRQVENEYYLVKGKLDESGDTVEILKEQLRLANLRANEAQTMLKNLEVEHAKTKSTLSDTQKQLNGTLSYLTDTNSRLIHTEDQLTQSKNNEAAAKETLARTELIVADKETQIKSKNEELKVKEEQIAEKDRMLRSDALSNYNKAVMEVHMYLNHDRIMSSFKLDRTLFLPEISFGGKTYMISAFRDFSGLNSHEGGYSKVTELEYKRRLPTNTNMKWMPMTNDVLCLREDPRVALIPVPSSLGTPLKTISLDELVKRGVDNLTLFKSDSFGKVTANLNGRCSLDLSDGKAVFYIRNGKRTSAEPAAAIGDFVISKEGQFVGVVVNVVSVDLGQATQAVCYVFPESLDIAGASKLRITKAPGASIFDDFCGQVENLRIKAEAFSKTGK